MSRTGERTSADAARPAVIEDAGLIAGNVDTARSSDEGSGAHTPGPWEIGDSAKGESSLMVYCDDSLGSRVADLSTCGHGISTAQARANARLIAAAPELLALAKKLASECADCGGTGDNSNDEPGNNPRDCDACADIRAAIAKAEGSK